MAGTKPMDVKTTSQPSGRAVAAALRAVRAGRDPIEVAKELKVTPDEFERLGRIVIARRRSQIVARLPLKFRETDPEAGSPVRESVSAVAAAGDGETLWIGADEGGSLERLTAKRDVSGAIKSFGGHRRFDLHELFDFPRGRKEEVDIEGLAIADGFLWVVGSHSLKRRKPRSGDDVDAALEALTTVEREANRFLIGRAPLAASDRPGVQDLVASAPPIDGGKRKRRSGSFKMTKRGSALSRALRKDVHLGPFMAIPSKDNGLDVEGMAVVDDRIYLGLRGPVLRGWATVVEIAFKAKRDGQLKLKRLEDGEVIRKHFLDLDGLGIRSLLIDGNDLLILAGPTMDLDGPVGLYRWRRALKSHDSSVVPQDMVERALDLPYGEGDDHAEGATLLRLGPGRPPSLLVGYDSPTRTRLTPDGGVLADVIAMPEKL